MQRPDCPDIHKCQIQLDEKWRQANQAVSRYGPPQPSVAFRCFRQLETFPTNPSLMMPHPYCQNAAKAWCASCEFINRPYVALGSITSAIRHTGLGRAEGRGTDGTVFDRMFQPKAISSPFSQGTEKVSSILLPVEATAREPVWGC